MMDGQTWYWDRKKRDEQAETASERLLGEEGRVFAAAMEAIDAVLDAAFGDRSIDDLAEKAKAAIAYRSRDLLWSAWREMLAARYDTATEHWRSITESPHFLRAITVKPELAKEWINGRLKIKAAWRAQRDRLRDAGHYETADSWHRILSGDAGMIHPFSHVTIESAVATMPIAKSAEGQPEAFVLGGAISDQMATRIGLYLAYEAIVTLHTCAFAFQQVPAVDELWDQRCEAIYKEGIRALERRYDDLGLAAALDGEMPMTGKEQLGGE